MCKCQRDRYKDPATENEKVINLREEVIKRLEQTVGNDQFLRNEPMKKHITFRVGGPAACFLMPSTKEQIEEIVHICQEEKTPCFILGNGSNLLVSDQGYDGAVLQIYKNMNQVAVNGEQLQVQAGALLSTIARKALDAGLTGMEFAAGIPGTLGGAVVMNAGAYGGEMKDILESVTVLTTKGRNRKKTVINEQLTVRRTVNKTDKIMNVCRNTVSRMKVSLWKPCFLMSFFTKKTLHISNNCLVTCKGLWYYV